MFSIFVEPIYIPTNSLEGCSLIHIFAIISCLLVDSQSSSCGAIPHCGFDLHFPNGLMMFKPFDVFFGIMSSFSAYFFNINLFILIAG